MINLQKPYELNFDYNLGDKFWVKANLKEGNIYNLMKGSHLPNMSSYNIVLETSGSEQNIKSNDILATNTPFPIVSSKVIELLQKTCPLDFQFFSVKVQNKKNKSDFFELDGQYWALNILNTVDAIDKDSSKLVLDQNNEILIINSLVFRLIENIEDRFWIAREKSFMPLILASPELKDAFVKHKIKGCQFLTDEQYNQISF